MARETIAQDIDTITDPLVILRDIWRQNAAIILTQREHTKEHKAMADAFDALDEKVDQDISDDTLAKQAYADLKAQLDAQTQVAVDAVNDSNLAKAEKEQAIADLEAGKARAQAAADRLAGSSPIASTDTPDEGGENPPA